LESVCWGNSTVGSNPTLSAIQSFVQSGEILIGKIRTHTFISLSWSRSGGNIYFAANSAQICSIVRQAISRAQVVERAALSPQLWKKVEKVGRERKIGSEHIESNLRHHCQRSPMSPNIYIIAGPNGVGKATFAREFLPNYANCRNFINADLIAQGMAPFSPETAAFRAGRLMLRLHGG
jgi:hypothetical protein